MRPITNENGCRKNILNGTQSDYTYSTNGTGNDRIITATDNQGNVQTLRQIEQIEFADGSKMDLTDAAVLEQMQTQYQRLKYDLVSDDSRAEHESKRLSEAVLLGMIVAKYTPESSAGVFDFLSDDVLDDPTLQAFALAQQTISNFASKGSTLEGVLSAIQNIVANVNAPQAIVQIDEIQPVSVNGMDSYQ